MRPFLRPVVFAVGFAGHGAVAGVAAEPEGLVAGVDGPGGPEGGAAVVDEARGHVLAGEGGDAGGDCVGGGRGRG